MSDWIKVDADHMPPDMQDVFVTIAFPTGTGTTKFVHPQTRWNEQIKTFECYFNHELYEDVTGAVTHWMPYPAPAQD